MTNLFLAQPPPRGLSARALLVAQDWSRTFDPGRI